MQLTLLLPALLAAIVPISTSAQMLQGAQCTPMVYNGSYCNSFINYYVYLPSDTSFTAQDKIVQVQYQLASELDTVDPVCVQDLRRLACAAAYPVCNTTTAGQTTGTAQILCQSSCQATLDRCQPAAQKLLDNAGVQLLQTTLNSCKQLSNLDPEPLAADGQCIDSFNPAASPGLAAAAPAPAASSGNTTMAPCPAFFLPQTSSGNKNCNPENNCCVPCPVQDYIYPVGQFNIAVVFTQIASLVSALLAAYVVLSWSVLPGRRQHPGDIVLHFTIAVMLWQACVLFLAGNPRRIQCHDAVTVATASNNLLCGIQGALLMCTVHAAVMWGGYMIFNLHATIVWRSSFFERIKPIGVTFCWGLPGVFTFIPFLLSQVDAVTGVTCIISSDKANMLFFSIQAVIVVPSFFLNIATMIHIMIVARRQSSSNLSGGYSSNGNSGNGYEGKPVSARRQMLQLLKLNWRALALGLVFVVTYSAYVAFFNVVVVPLSSTTAQTPWVQAWVACIALGGSQNECSAKFSSNIPTFSLIIISAIVSSSVGLWIFIIFGFNLQIIYDWMNWFDDLRSGRLRKSAAQEEPEWR
ncbi:hypothetical protein HK101_001295 [Irineochytrium annulatum]|nr:hypothetical protein HK101_001295 [Irineochytrium annulatum]